MIRPLHAVSAAVLALALSACGFHLRNAVTLPEDLGPVRVVSSDPYSPLNQALAQALSRIGAPAPAENATEAATLEVISEKWGSRPISIDELGRAQEYSLRYAVVFGLRAANGDDVVPQQTIELSRDYISSPTNPTGSEGEQELLAKEMRREMVASILRRIDASERATEPPARQSPESPASQPDASPVPGQTANP
ncbi:MAG TPA: LPS assembly lipoprotein LptE [Luteimonas sp.]|nr:LPS assembly lipoprotein LptE [Luteimonas sp.]